MAPVKRPLQRLKWRCLCICGASVEVTGVHLRKGTRSCGCLKRRTESNLTHGHASKKKGVTRTYRTWMGMHQRCTNPGNRSYASYGGRGIAVCARWSSFENFLTDMGERPYGLTLGRIDNEKGYDQANCRWESGLDQARNKTTTRWLVVHGERAPLSVWAERVGLRQGTIRQRLAAGWSHDDAILLSRLSGAPRLSPGSVSKVKLTRDMVNEARALKNMGWTLDELASRFGVSSTTIHRGLKAGYHAQ